MTTEERLERLERKLDMLLSHLGVGANGGRPRAGGGAVSAQGQGAEVASDSDLDGSHGNPEVRFVPKRWDGPNFKGVTYSECTPDFLDMLAESLEYFATRDDESGAVDKNGNPKSKWGRLDASRARGWARRLRGGGGAGAKRAAAPRVNGASRPAGDEFATGGGAGDFGGGSDFGADDDIPF